MSLGLSEVLIVVLVLILFFGATIAAYLARKRRR